MHTERRVLNRLRTSICELRPYTACLYIVILEIARNIGCISALDKRIQNYQFLRSKQNLGEVVISLMVSAKKMSA